VPEDLEINTEILVDEDASHADDVGSRDFVELLANGVRNVASGLTDHLEVPDDRIDCFPIWAERVEIDSFSNLPIASAASSMSSMRRRQFLGGTDSFLQDSIAKLWLECVRCHQVHVPAQDRLERAL
jgi:hypothetical protein